MQQRVTPLKANQNEWTARQLLEQWVRYLQDHDRSAGTVKKYTQAVDHFLAWYEHEEQSPLILSALTPIALIGYRNALQHEQRKSRSPVNARISALRSWCGWMTEQGFLAADPAARVKTGWRRGGVLANRAEKCPDQCPAPSGPEFSWQRT
jgi:site-specific recombinase XerC